MAAGELQKLVLKKFAPIQGLELWERLQSVE